MKSIQHLLPLLLLLSLPTGIGCGDRLPTEPKENVIMPLAKGNVWIGTLTTFAGDGTVSASRPDTVLVTQVYEWEGETWYGVRGPAFYGCLYRNNADGLWWTLGNPTTCLRLYARYPAGRNDTCNTYVSKSYITMRDQNGLEYDEPIDVISANVLEASDTVVTVPLGSYSCYLYRETILSPSNVRFTVEIPWVYFVPGTGPVKIEWYQGGSPQKGRRTKVWELREMKLY